MKALLACLGLAAAAYSQDPFGSRPQILGVVVEGGTDLGLAGAQISLSGLDALSQIPPQSAVSDSQGLFHFDLDKFGRYRVTVKMEGYKPVGNMTMQGLPPILASFEPGPVAVTAGNPKQNLRFVLVRPAELTGRVVDEETGKPIPRLPVAALILNYSKGQRVLVFRARGMTDEDGQFNFSGLVPGNFLVETLPRALGPQQFQIQFSADDLKAGDQDYERSFWPGGLDADAASPIAVGSGASVDVGTLKPRKVLYYKVHAVFRTSPCTPGQSVDVLLEPVAANHGIEPVNSQVTCGQDFVVRSLQPGSYRLTLSSGRTPEARVQGSFPVEIRDGNADVSVSVSSGLNLDGQVIAADGSGKPPGGLLVTVQPVDTRAAYGPPLRPDSQGMFHVVNAALGRQRLSLSNLGKFYVKEIRYNGIAVPDGNFTLDGSPGRLEVVVDDKPAVVAGVVQDQGNPVSKAYVALVTWPVSPENLFAAMKNATGDESGKFRFAGLAPGDYKIVAVPQETRSLLDEPGVLDRLLASADKVSVGPGESESLQLKPVDPSR